MAKFPLSLLKTLGSGLRIGWLILGMTLIAVLALEAGARLALEARTGLMDRLQGERWMTDLQAHRPAAAADRNSEWFHDLRREQDAAQFVPRPYVHWRQRPYRGRYLNIDQDGLRATWNPSPPEDPDRPPAVRVFTFGGSSMWGWGARDDYTIASYLSKLLHERGYHAQVVNYGEVAYVSTQEVITLLRCIQRGETPDIALFYDGFNEVSVSYLGRGTGGRDLPLVDAWQRSRKSAAPTTPRGWWADGRAFLHRNLWGSRRVMNGLQRRILPRTSASARPQPLPVNDELARRVMRRYQANLTIVEALGRYYGFEPLFYWQPTLYSKRRRSPYEQTIDSPYFLRYEEIFDDLYRRARESEFLNGHPRFHDLSALFDASAGPYYVDPAHLSEAGNRLVAEAMIEDVIALIERRGADGAGSERGE